MSALSLHYFQGSSGFQIRPHGILPSRTQVTIVVPSIRCNTARDMFVNLTRPEKSTIKCSLSNTNAESLLDISTSTTCHEVRTGMSSQKLQEELQASRLAVRQKFLSPNYPVNTNATNRETDARYRLSKLSSLDCLLT